MVRLHRNSSIDYLEPTVGHALARLSGLEGLARSMMAGVVPLAALNTLGDKQSVSVAFSVGAVFALAITINLGTLERRFYRRWVVNGAIVALFLAALLFAVGSGWAARIGIGLRSAAASTFGVMLTIYVMDYVGKRDLTLNESRRLFYNGGAWLFGPFLGVWLWDNVDHAAPFLLSAGLSLTVLAYYWKLRLGGDNIITDAKSHPTNPIKTIPRYFKQKNMRIAYAITLVRSMFWVSIFVYAPLYVTEAGLNPTVSGAMLSGVAALLLLSPMIRNVAERVGTRAIAGAGFIVIGIGMIGLGSLGEPRPLGVAFWVFAAVGATWIDVVGNIPFMRLVKPRERVPMATVFSTWREVSEFIAPGIAAVVLALSVPFAAYYFIIGGLSLATVAVVSFLPRRL